VIAGIDSMILIYAGIVPQRNGKAKSAKAKKLTHRAKVLMDQLKDETIVLPTIAVAELLVPVPAAQKGSLIATLIGMFHCRPFDLHAAAIGSDLWARHKSLPVDLQYKNRHVLKADVMIIATAKAGSATKFYSHDKSCRALANLVMQAADLPTHSEDLFFGQDV